MRASKKSSPGLEEFLSHISLEQIEPVYLFTGDQVHLVEKALNGLRSTVFGRNDDMNYIVFQGDSISGEEIVESASTVPMFSSRKVVIIKNADKLKDKDLTAIERYIDSPSGASSLILIYSDGKAPKIKKRKLPHFDFSVEKGNTVSIVREEARRLGFAISPKAAGTLISLVGEDLKELNNELLKLTLFRPNTKTIEIEDIENHTRKSQFGDVFSLINALSKKNAREAHKALLDLEKQGEEPLSILSRLLWRYRLIWKAKELSDTNTPKAQILKELKMSQGAYYYLSQDVGKYSYQDLTRIMAQLLECDKKLKISYVPRNFHLTRLVMELCTKAK